MKEAGLGVGGRWRGGAGGIGGVGGAGGGGGWGGGGGGGGGGGEGVERGTWSQGYSQSLAMCTIDPPSSHSHGD